MKNSPALKYAGLVPAALLAAALTGCVVTPPSVRPLYAPPPGVAYVQPGYAIPAPGYIWAYHPNYGWGWHHPQYGWHKGWR